jgi:tRNA dimethylallyltransferase
VGGTGQYVKAIIEGWEIPGVEPRPELREALEKWAEQIGPQGLYGRLNVLDPTAAARIDPQNLRRTVRALEVILHTGVLFSSQRKKHEPKYRNLLLGLNRPRVELYERIDARIQSMFEAGFVGEVKAILDDGYSPDLPSLSAIGYRQVIAHLQGETTLEEVEIQMKRITRQFVRRQANWFKTDDPSIHWYQVRENVLAEIEKTILEFLG